MSDSSDMECEVSCSQENCNTISADNNKVPSKKQNDIAKVCDFSDMEYEVSQVFYSQKNRDTILTDDKKFLVRNRIIPQLVPVSIKGIKKCRRTESRALK